jgi:CzcA family heavy metal efflux pump
MFAWIIRSSLTFRFLIIAAAAALIAFGADELRRMPVDVFPEFAPPKVEVQTEGLGMTSTEVEELITIPIEDALRGTPGVDVIRSSSVVGLSQVVLLFRPGTDLMTARQRVQERIKLAIAELPQSAGLPEILQPLSSTSRVMKIGITSKTYDLPALSMIAYWTIKFRLMAVDGVANIPIWGERPQTVNVEVAPSLMSAYLVSLNDVLESVSGALEVGLLPYAQSAKTRIDGMLDTPNQRLVIHQQSPVLSPEELATVPIGQFDRRVKRLDAPRLSDVAEVKWGTRPVIGDAVINGQPGLMLIVEKLPWANTLDVTRGVEAALEALRPGLPGIEIDAKIFRPATFIEMSMHNLTISLIVGALLVILVLGAFLYEWRVALVSVIAIPLSLVVAGLVLELMGASVNTMVLAGFIVALGSVVDDAIIDVENVVRRLRQHRLAGGTRSTARIILDASLEVRPAIWHATVIIVLAVVPVFFMGGLSGAFFEPLALAFLLAMLASMVVALTVTPALCLILLDRDGVEKRQSPLVPWLRQQYEQALARIIAAPRATFAITGVFVLAGLVVLPFFGSSLLPSFRERDFLMHWVPPEGTSHPETLRITTRASHELQAIPGVSHFGAHVGRAVGGDEPYGVNFTENWVSVDRDVDLDATRGTIESTVNGYPGLYRDVQTYLRERIKEVLTGSGESIVVRIFGPELPVMRREAERIHEAIKDVPGLAELHIEQQVDVPQVQIRVDLDAAAHYGLKPGDIRRATAVYVSGIEVSDIFRDGKVYGVWLWTPESFRSDLESIRNFPIDTPFGGRVRLGEVAKVELVSTANKVRRENGSRRLDITANVHGRDLGAVAQEVDARLAKMSFPIGYYPQLLGEYRERKDAQRTLILASTVVVLAMLLVLQASLRRWHLAGLILLALPAALVGAVLAAFAGDRVISLGSLVGIITVLGIAARNGIMLFQHFRHLEIVEREPFGVALVLRGASERLSPILMTSLCTAVALLPLVVTGNIPGHEIEHPMAVMILGGLVTSTLLSLFVLPVLYLRIERRRPMIVEPVPIAPQQAKAEHEHTA